MPQTLRHTFSPRSHARSRLHLPAAPLYVMPQSLEGFLAALQAMLRTAGGELLQPRQKVVKAILREAYLL